MKGNRSFVERVSFSVSFKEKPLKHREVACTRVFSYSNRRAFRTGKARLLVRLNLNGQFLRLPNSEDNFCLCS